MLIAFGFTPWITARVMTCVSSAHLFNALNGELVGYFLASRGPHQGDPLSPLLLVMTMEVSTGLMKMNAVDPAFSSTGGARKPA